MVGKLGVSVALLQPALPKACRDWPDGDIGKGQLLKECGWDDVSVTLGDVVLSCVPTPPSTDTSDMSFEELLELQHKVGTKTYKQLVAGNNTKKPSSRPPVQNACVADKHR